jgi:hypothetical protein
MRGVGCQYDGVRNCPAESCRNRIITEFIDKELICNDQLDLVGEMLFNILADSSHDPKSSMALIIDIVAD